MKYDFQLKQSVFHEKLNFVFAEALEWHFSLTQKKNQLHLSMLERTRAMINASITMLFQNRNLRAF